MAARTTHKNDLTYAIDFEVTGLDYRTQEITSDNGVCGPGSFLRLTGTLPHVKIGVKALNEGGSREKIRTLEFIGQIYLSPGNRIQADVPKYNLVYGKETGAIIGGKMCREIFYEERDFNETEGVELIRRLLDETSRGEIVFRGVSLNLPA